MGTRNLEEPHSRVGSLKRMRSVVFRTSKGYGSAEWALLSGHNDLAQMVEHFYLKEKAVSSTLTVVIKRKVPLNVSLKVA